MTHCTMLVWVTRLVLKLHMQVLSVLSYSLILNCIHVVPDPLWFTYVFIIYVWIIHRKLEIKILHSCLNEVLFLLSWLVLFAIQAQERNWKGDTALRWDFVGTRHGQGEKNYTLLQNLTVLFCNPVPQLLLATLHRRDFWPVLVR